MSYQSPLTTHKGIWRIYSSRVPNIDWLIIYRFMSRSIIFHLYGDVTIAGEGLQNWGLCSALRAFEQGGIFIVPRLLWYRTSVIRVLSERPPHLVASYDTRSDVEDLFQPGSSRGSPTLKNILSCTCIYREASYDIMSQLIRNCHIPREHYFLTLRFVCCNILVRFVKYECCRLLRTDATFLNNI
jgi:hypothetical protein